MNSQRLIEVVLFGISIARSKSKRPLYTVLGRLFQENVLLIPAILFSKYPTFPSTLIFLKFVALYTLCLLTLTAIYEFFYLLNDALFVRFEDIPTLRDYVKMISVKRALFLRLIYAMIFTIILIIIFSVSLTNIIVAIGLLSWSLLLHNLQKVKIKRIATFSLVRFSRYMFIPLAIGYSDKNILFYCLIVLLPLFIAEIVAAYNYQLKKYNIAIPLSHNLYVIRRAYLFGMFLPAQLLFVYPNVHIVLGNIVLTIIMFLKHL